MAKDESKGEPKPGSKLAALKALGRPGIGRAVERGVARVAQAMTPRQPLPPPPPPDFAHAPTPGPRKRIPAAPPDPPRGSAAAKAVLAEVEAKIAAGETLKSLKPWDLLGVKRSTYFGWKKTGKV